MDSGLVSKIEKAKRYAEERERILFTDFRVTLKGENNLHYVSFSADGWKCDCSFFAARGFCSHTMALERILEKMLPESEA